MQLSDFPLMEPDDSKNIFFAMPIWNEDNRDIRILPGNRMIFRLQHTAESGALIAAMYNGNSVIARWWPKDDGDTLVFHSDRIPITIDYEKDQFRIYGIAVQHLIPIDDEGITHV